MDEDSKGVCPTCGQPIGVRFTTSETFHREANYTAVDLARDLGVLRDWVTEHMSEVGGEGQPKDD